MKLCKKMLVVVLYISTAADCVGSSRSDIESIKEKLAAAKKNTPAVQRALRSKYPDPEADDARVLYGFVHGVREPLLGLMDKAIKVSTDPWVLEESSTIFAQCEKRLSEQPPLLLPEMGYAQKFYADSFRMAQLYKEELDGRHPESCSVCPKSFWLRKLRCAGLHKEYKFWQEALEIFKKAAQLEKRDPALLEKYAQLDPTMLGHRVSQKTKDGN